MGSALALGLQRAKETNKMLLCLMAQRALGRSTGAKLATAFLSSVG